MPDWCISFMFNIHYTEYYSCFVFAHAWPFQLSCSNCNVTWFPHGGTIHLFTWFLLEASVSARFPSFQLRQRCSVSSLLAASPSPLRHLIPLISEISSPRFIHTCNAWLRSNGDLKYDKSICWAQIESVTPTTAIDHNHTIMKRWDTLALWGGCFAKMAHVKPHLYKWALDLSQRRG